MQLDLPLESKSRLMNGMLVPLALNFRFGLSWVRSSSLLLKPLIKRRLFLGLATPRFRAAAGLDALNTEKLQLFYILSPKYS